MSKIPIVLYSLLPYYTNDALPNGQHLLLAICIHSQGIRMFPIHNHRPEALFIEIYIFRWLGAQNHVIPQQYFRYRTLRLQLVYRASIRILSHGAYVKRKINGRTLNLIRKIVDDYENTVSKLIGQKRCAPNRIIIIRNKI